MDELRQKLAPVTDWIPGGIRDQLPIPAWWGILVGIVLLGFILLLLMLRRLFGGSPGEPVYASPPEEIEDLRQYPPLQRAPGGNVATIYQVPARLRLVIVAPVGKAMTVEAAAVEQMLDQIVPGLGQVARDDRPRVRIWPAQISHHGFGSTFHNTTQTFEAAGASSHWIIVAGRAQVGRQPIAVGLAFWAEQPNTVGRLNLEMNQWLDVIRMKPTK